MNRMRKLYLIGFMTVLWAVLLQAPLLGQEILTAHEESNFENYTGFEEMWDFLQQVQASSTEMLLSDFGSTIEGRRQPYAVLSRPLITQPWEAAAAGKPIALLAANVHGGERTVRESLLMLTRDLAAKGTRENALLDKVVVIIAPSINCDGFVRATRGNSLGIDMNRDYIKLEQPALSNYVQNLWLKWQPHVELDGHNGGSYPYNICYQGPAHAAGDQRLNELSDLQIFPYIDAAMEREGYKSWYYSGGDREAWRTGLTDARCNNVYGGFINCVSILYESPGGQDREIGAKSGYVASRALLEFCAEYPEKVIKYIEDARRETIELGQKAQGDIAIAVEKGPQDYKVSYLIAEGRGEEREIIEVTDALLMSKPMVTKSRPRPYAYILEPPAVKAIALLRQHDILVEVLQEETELDIEAYQASGIERTSQYDHPASVTVTCEDETVKETRIFPQGSFIVRTGQVQGRLVTHMLEPETNDNVITWNSMDALLPRVGGGGGGRGMPDPTIMAGRARFTDPNQIAAMIQRAGGRGGARAGERVDPEMAQRMRQFTQGQPRQAIIPIYKLMMPRPLPMKIMKD